jgi:hypothetical protein
MFIKRAGVFYRGYKHEAYYFNGKLFGIRAIEHRDLRYHNIRVQNNSIIYDETCSKTFRGGLDDLKHNPREVRHICHRLDQATGSHESCYLQNVFGKNSGFSIML